MDWYINNQSLVGRTFNLQKTRFKQPFFTTRIDTGQTVSDTNTHTTLTKAGEAKSLLREKTIDHGGRVTVDFFQEFHNLINVSKSQLGDLCHCHFILRWDD